MVSKEINDYYDATENSTIRVDLEQAISFINNSNSNSVNSKNKIAIDCGCGAGSNINHLLENGFDVHAFDIETESISRCTERFKNEPRLNLTQDSFGSFTYPNTALVLADASLFFCPKKEFPTAWQKIIAALDTGGIFVGSFLGPRDTTASTAYEKDIFWRDVLVMTETPLRALFDKFNIINFTEHESTGKTAQNKPHHWHIFSVVAVKK